MIEIIDGDKRVWVQLARGSLNDPTVHYMPCPNHEAAIEVEGNCPCFDGLEIDWDKTDIWGKRTAPEGK